MKTRRRPAAAKRRPAAAKKGRPVRRAPRVASDETRRLLHELQVHSEEITVQNDQLLRTQAELERARDRYADLYDHAPIGYMELDPRGTILDINHAGCVLLGRKRDAVINLPLATHVTKEHRQVVRDYLSRISAREQRTFPEIEFRTNQSPPRVVRLLTRRIAVEPGVNRLLTAMFDVTSHRALENDRRDALEREQARTLELAREVIERTQAESRARSLVERLVTVQEEERRRLALNLHDQLGQQLTALKLMLGHLKSPAGAAKAERRMVEIEELVERMDRDVDFLAWELRPAALDDVGLEAALATFVRQWGSQHGVPAEFHSSQWEAARPAPAVELNLYRIAQEALNNVAKHATATHVSILLERRGDEAMLIVEDNGRGFDAERALDARAGHQGMGLAGIRERTDMIGGSVQIETRPGKGATIFVKVPIERPGS